MKHIIRLLLCIFLFHNCQAQPNNNMRYMQWVFGYEDYPEVNIGWNIIDFNDGAVDIREYNPPNKQYTIGRTGSVICDEDGQVELLSNICDLRDENLQVIPGGEMLTENREIIEAFCDQGFEYPVSHASRFYLKEQGYDLFYLDTFDEFPSKDVRRISSKNLYQLKIRGSREQGYTLNRNTLLTGLFEDGRLKTTYHANGEDVWIIINPLESDTLLSYLIMGDSISLRSTSVLGPKLIPGETGFYSSLAFSANNDMMTMVSPVGIMLYDFDDETGAFTDYRNIEIPFFSFSGVCFSPSDRFLYAGNADNLFQVDLSSDRENPTIHDYGSIFTTEIDSTGWPIGVGNMVTGPDCRIYVSPGSTSHFMHVIHNPEGEGEAAELQKYIPIPNRFFFDFPTVPNLFPHCDPDIAFDIRTSVLEPIETAHPMVVFPNPATDATTINIDPDYAGQLYVYDLQGRLLFRDAVLQNTYQYDVDLSEWQSGMYVLRYESEQGVYVGKLIVED